MYLADIFTVPANLAGHPWPLAALRLSSRACPSASSCSGRPFDEADLLRAGHALQERTDYHRRRPPV